MAYFLWVLDSFLEVCRISWPWRRESFGLWVPCATHTTGRELWAWEGLRNLETYSLMTNTEIHSDAIQKYFTRQHKTIPQAIIVISVSRPERSCMIRFMFITFYFSFQDLILRFFFSQSRFFWIFISFSYCISFMSWYSCEGWDQMAEVFWLSVYRAWFLLSRQWSTP